MTLRLQEEQIEQSLLSKASRDLPESQVPANQISSPENSSGEGVLDEFA